MTVPAPGCVSGTPSPSASGAGEEPGLCVLRAEDPSLPSTTCCLHRGAGLSKQLLMLFTRNFCPGAAGSEEPSVTAAVIRLSQLACPFSPQAVPQQGLQNRYLKPCARGLLTHSGIELSCIQTHQILAVPAAEQARSCCCHTLEPTTIVLDGLQGGRMPVPAKDGFWNR